jgi:polyisoprenoid-binding protein YceI
LRPIVPILVLALAAPLAAHAQSANTADPAAVRAGAYKLDPSHSKITWSVNHFGFSTYVGQFGHVDATMTLDPKDLAATSLEATIDAASLGTLNPSLDNQVKSKNFLDVAQFATAAFHATKVARTGERTADITGDLMLRGITLPVTVQATFIQAGRNVVDPTYRLGFAGRAKIKRSDFGMTYLLPTLGDEVTLDIEAEFRLQPPAGAQPATPKY